MSDFGCGEFVGRMGTVDSASFLINELLKPFRTARNICALVGLYYASKGVYWMLKSARGYLNLKSLTNTTRALIGFHNTSYQSKFGTFALVSNVAEGLSTEIVFALAARGMNILLVGPNPNYLEKLQHKLRYEYGVQGIILVTNFYRCYQMRDVLNVIATFDIGIFVNYLGEIESTDCYYANCEPHDEWKQIPKSVGKTMMLTRFILPGMYSRGHGVIVNVLPKRMVRNEQLLSYSVTAMSSISFVKTFGDSIRTSYAFRGIKVQSITPFMDAFDDGAFPRGGLSKFNPTMAQYAKSLVSKIGSSENTHGHWAHSLYNALSQHLPEFLLKKITEKLKPGETFEADRNEPVEVLLEIED